MVATITRDELRAKIERGDQFTLVEALAPDEYARAHLPRAVNLPYERVEQIMERAPALLPDKDADIVVYCGNTL